MGAGHDELVPLVGAGDLGHRVVGLGVVLVEAGGDVDLELDGLVVIEQAEDLVVVLGGHHERRGRWRSLPGSQEPPPDTLRMPSLRELASTVASTFSCSMNSLERVPHLQARSRPARRLGSRSRLSNSPSSGR